MLKKSRMHPSVTAGPDCLLLGWGRGKDGSWRLHKLSTLRKRLVNVSQGMLFLQLFRYTHKHSLNININSAHIPSLRYTQAPQKHAYTNAGPQKHTQSTSRRVKTRKAHTFHTWTQLKSSMCTHLEISTWALFD